MSNFSIEEALRLFLKSKGYKSYVGVPAKRPERFCTIERVGGGIHDKCDFPRVAVQCWSTSRAQSEQDALSIRDILVFGVLPKGVYQIELNTGPYNFPDPDSRCSRYQAIYEVACKI